MSLAPAKVSPTKWLYRVLQGHGQGNDNNYMRYGLRKGLNVRLGFRTTIYYHTETSTTILLASKYLRDHLGFSKRWVAMHGSGLTSRRHKPKP